MQVQYQLLHVSLDTTLCPGSAASDTAELQQHANQHSTVCWSQPGVAYVSTRTPQRRCPNGTLNQLSLVFSRCFDLDLDANPDQHTRANDQQPDSSGQKTQHPVPIPAQGPTITWNHSLLVARPCQCLPAAIHK
jgi:hypothetical protein